VAEIAEFTIEHFASLPDVYREWIGVGLSTEPADRQRAEAGVRIRPLDLAAFAWRRTRNVPALPSANGGR
jgi:hypothetical protein